MRARLRATPGRVGAAAAIAAALCAALWLVSPAAAQEPSAGAELTAAADTDPAEIARRSAALADERAAAERGRRAASDAAERAHVEEVLDRLGTLEGLLRKEAQLAAAPAEVSASEAAGEESAAAPASVFELNRLEEEAVGLEAKLDRRSEVLEARTEALAAAKQKLASAERLRREARAAAEEAEPAGKAAAERALALRQLESRIARERVSLRTLELAEVRRAGDPSAARKDLEERIDRLREVLSRGEGDPSDGLAALTERQRALRLEREAAERRLASAELRLDAAQQRFARQLDPPPELLEQVEALRAQRDLVHQEIELIDARAERLGAQRTLWRQWSALLRGEGTREEIEAWRQALEERTNALEQSALEREDRQADLEARQRDLQARLARRPDGDRLRPVLEEQQAALSRLLEAERSEGAEVAADLRLAERVDDELGERTGEIDLLEYAGDAVRSVRSLWSYEITSIDDAPITVGSLVLALLLASVGLWASRLGSAFVGRLATRRLRLDTGAADALQTLSFYVLLVSFTLLALRAVHFPLTAFTVLGGALAIGLGFGSQNVMNNFISGLIIMLERPIRSGDVIEVNDDHGTVERIGARSTQIRSMDGRHIVVPNSSFLQNNVVNWTLSDDLIRTSVLVGVVYGSPTRLVRDLILRVVEEEAQILKRPEPTIIFDEFGDNSLNFEVFFWVRARTPMGMRKIQSDVRFRIDDLFREHGLVIAFPQRDVHLDSVSPIQVRLVEEGSGTREPD